MKRICLVAFCACVILSFVSCSDTKKSWENFYSYTSADIIGNYSFSNEKDAFASLTEGTYCHICEDAEISIQPNRNQSVEVTVKCSNDNFEQTFRGAPSSTPDDYRMDLSTRMTPSGNGRYKSYTFSAVVMKDDLNRVRLHGSASLNIWKYEDDTISTPHNDGMILHSSTKYYFDIIKDE